MLATNHVIFGASVGLIVKDPYLAFVSGTVSHLILDSIPHWGSSIAGVNNDKLFIKVARADGLTLLTVFALLAFLPIDNRLPILLGAFGGLLFDLDKPMMHFFKIKIWPSWFDKLNIIIQRESPKRWWVELIAFILFISLFTVLLAR